MRFDFMVFQRLDQVYHRSKILNIWKLRFSNISIFSISNLQHCYILTQDNILDKTLFHTENTEFHIVLDLHEEFLKDSSFCFSQPDKYLPEFINGDESDVLNNMKRKQRTLEMSLILRPSWQHSRRVWTCWRTRIARRVYKSILSSPLTHTDFPTTILQLVFLVIELQLIVTKSLHQLIFMNYTVSTKIRYLQRDLDLYKFLVHGNSSELQGTCILRMKQMNEQLHYKVFASIDICGSISFWFWFINPKISVHIIIDYSEQFLFVWFIIKLYYEHCVQPFHVENSFNFSFP